MWLEPRTWNALRGGALRLCVEIEMKGNTFTSLRFTSNLLTVVAHNAFVHEADLCCREQGCLFKAESLPKLVHHSLTHSNTRLYKCTYREDCRLTFRAANELARHINLCHLGKGFSCKRHYWITGLPQRKFVFHESQECRLRSEEEKEAAKVTALRLWRQKLR